MRKVLVLSAILLVFACSGQKVQLNNGTGLDLTTVTLTIGENSQTWNDIEADKTFGSDIEFPSSATPILLEWETLAEQWSMEYISIDSAFVAKRVSILFAPDEMSVNYSF